MAATEESIVGDLTDLLSGKPLTRCQVDVGCDAAAGFTPKTKSNVCYIVGAVLFNEKGEVLLIQEAKPSCYGTWYLPMGRLERGESLQEGAVREVLEEAGLHFTPTSILSVALGPGSWQRVLFCGTITGGQLKTVEEKDEESLQAEWVNYEEIINPTKRTRRFRASDMLKPIKLGHKYYSQTPEERAPPYLPSVVPHRQLLLRMVLMRTIDGGDVQVLVNTHDGDHFPVSVICVRDFHIEAVVHRLLRAVAEKSKETPDILGTLAVEYCGKPPGKNDGICLTVLGRMKDGKSGEVNLDSGYSWKTIPEGQTLNDLRTRAEKQQFVPFLFSGF